MAEIIGVRFKSGGKQYYFDPQGIRVQEGQEVIVETSRGVEYGECVQPNIQMADEAIVQPLRPVLRIATEEDKKTLIKNREKEEKAFQICQEKIIEHGLEMKLVDTEYSFEGNKVLFFFTAEGRVDFRALVKDLASTIHARIELRQIGVRDEAKMLGGLGICGRPFCCSQFLDDFQPDVVHLNNFNFQLTPSIIYEVKSYEKKADKKVKILFTAHDYQLVCPNHMMRTVKTNQNCSKCSNGNYLNCIKEKCIHGSTVKSVLGAVEGWVYRFLKAYQYIDTVICPSRFLQEKMEKHPYLKGKTMVMQNFSIVEDGKMGDDITKEDYIVYFGRYSKEKGIETLLKVCEMLPEIPFVFAGKGPLEEQVNQVKNIENKGFLSGKELEEDIRKARFSVYPSEWYENCPFSIMESIQYGTPVLGADIGGIPELIEAGETGELFESGNAKELVDKIQKLWKKEELVEH